MELQYSHGRVFWEARNPNFLRPSFEAKAELESRLNSNKIRIWGSYGGSLFGEAQLEIRVCMTQSISSAHNAGPSVNPAHACFFESKYLFLQNWKLKPAQLGKVTGVKMGEEENPVILKWESHNHDLLKGLDSLRKVRRTKNHSSFWFRFALLSQLGGIGGGSKLEKKFA